VKSHVPLSIFNDGAKWLVLTDGCLESVRGSVRSPGVGAAPPHPGF